jgi:RNA polymerase Rpb1, domain 1
MKAAGVKKQVAKPNPPKSATGSNRKTVTTKPTNQKPGNVKVQQPNTSKPVLTNQKPGNVKVGQPITSKPVLTSRSVVERQPDMRSIESKSIHLYAKTLTFGFYTAEDIRKISVVKIINNHTLNRLGHAELGGLYDPRMGPGSDKPGESQICDTCNGIFSSCPGHYGHIELPLPVYHPLFLRNLSDTIKLTCPVCKKFLLSGI